MRDDNFNPVNEHETLGQDRKLHQALGEKSQERKKKKKKEMQENSVIREGKKVPKRRRKEREAE